MAKKSAKSPKVKPVKQKASGKRAAKPGGIESLANELRSAAKASAARRLKK
jgi:hypothetical protein